MTDDASALADWLRIQSRWCERLDSPLYASLLPRAADDAEARGPVFDVLRGHESDPPGSALALRFMGSVHRLVLTGAAPALAAFYPSVAGAPVDGDPWPAFHETVADNVATLRELVNDPVQTNEPGRTASLLGGFLEIAHETGLPLRLLEIGSSAGLNLRWDHYRYESGAWSWGDETSPLRITDLFVEDAPEPGPASVADRMGCDANPIDPMTEDGRLTLMAYLWPDQTGRFARLQAALRVAQAVPARVERADAVTWLGELLTVATPGVSTVVFHSIVMQYLSEAGRAELRHVVEAAGTRATPAAPFAWLRFEPSRPNGSGRGLVTLTTWPGGHERLLAESYPHGPPIRWLGGRPASA